MPPLPWAEVETKAAASENRRSDLQQWRPCCLVARSREILGRSEKSGMGQNTPRCFRIEREVRIQGKRIQVFVKLLAHKTALHTRGPIPPKVAKLDGYSLRFWGPEARVSQPTEDSA